MPLLLVVMRAGARDRNAVQNVSPLTNSRAFIGGRFLADFTAVSIHFADGGRNGAGNFGAYQVRDSSGVDSAIFFYGDPWVALKTTYTLFWAREPRPE